MLDIPRGAVPFFLWMKINSTTCTTRFFKKELFVSAFWQHGGAVA
jgi:hypothetical protein